MAPKVDMRMEALDTLVDMDRKGKLSHIAIGDSMLRLQFLDRKERAFYKTLCEGVTERQLYLDYVLDHISSVPMRKCKPLIRNLLRMSAYQILFMDVPDHAACDQAVRMARKRKFGRLSGFVNGVVRSLARQAGNLPLPDRDENETEYLSVLYSMPEAVTELLIRQYGVEKTEKMLAFFLTRRPITIRTCISKTDPPALKKMLEEEGVSVREGQLIPGAFEIEAPDSLRRVKAFRQGYFTVQDESSMLPVRLADPAPGSLVVDVCAAPGGKALHAADLLSGDGLVIARDLTPAKTDMIRENCERIGTDIVRVEERDARDPDPDLFGKADLVLADLPCSGLGVMARKNDIKYHISDRQLDDLVRLQREILSVVWQYVRPGGQLIYSTCTLNKGENEEQVSWIRENTPLVPESIEERLPACLRGRTGEQGYITLIPGQDPCDGFFAAAFRRPQE